MENLGKFFFKKPKQCKCKYKAIISRITGSYQKGEGGDFPGGPVVKAPHSQCRGHTFDSWSGTKILHAAWRGQKIKKGGGEGGM